MPCSLKYLFFITTFVLFCFNGLTLFATTYNYNYLLVHEQSLIAEPIFINPFPSVNHRTSRPTLIEYSELRKYELRDTNYRAEDHDLDFQDQSMLFSMEPLGVFASEQIVIENYRLLELRKFPVEFTNPSQRLTVVVTQITTDRSEVKHQRNSLPVTLNPGGTHAFNFQLYVSDLNPQHLQCALYFFIQIYDGKILAEEKVYARKVSATITPNHLRLEAHIFRSCPRYQTLVIKNYEIFEIGLTIQGDKQIETTEGTILSGEIRLQPTKSLKILMEGKSNQLLIHTSQTVNGHSFPSLMVQAICEDAVRIDYFNIGIIPGEKYVFEYPLTVSSSRKDNVTIIQVQLQSSSQTVIFEQMPFHSKFCIQPMVKQYQIGVIRILSRKKPEKRSVITVRLQMATANDEFWTQQTFYYQEMRTPISVGAKRFIDLKRLNSVNPGPERFTLKNNLNIPVFLTRYFCQQEYFQLSWSGERRKFVYPNLSMEELTLRYVGPMQIPLSPQKHMILLEFNGNLMIPLEIVVYDKTLRCLLDNQEQRCSNIQALQFEFIREDKVKGRQLVFRNWNPEYLPFFISFPVEEGKEHGLNVTFQIFGPLPGEGDALKKENYLDTILETNQFIIVDIEIEVVDNPGITSYLPLEVRTGYEHFQIGIITRIENGTIALIPQVVRFQIPFTKTIEYLNLVSTFSQSYRIETVITNVSSIFVAIPPHEELRSNQFVGMTVVYDPFLPELNITSGDWSIAKKQSDYNLFMKRRDFQAVLYAEVTLRTTTKLEARSMVIIDRSYTPMIETINYFDEDRGVRGMSFVLIKRLSKPARYGQTRQVYEITFYIRNSFFLPMKYRPFLLSEFKFKGMHNYFREYRNIKNNKKETVIFCISEAMKAKHRLTPSAIKEIFSLQQHPDEYSMQVSSDEEGQGHITLIPKTIKNHTIKVMTKNQGFDFLIQLNKRKYRTCMYFQEHEVIARLFLSELPYSILEAEGERGFRDLIKSELYNIQHTTFFLNDKDPHLRNKHYSDPNCLENPDYVIYNFCDSLKARVQSVVSEKGDKVHQLIDQTYVLAPSQIHRVTVQIFNPQNVLKMFLVLANNFTMFQTYQADITINSPRISVHHDDYLSPFISQNEEEFWEKWKRANLLAVDLFLEDFRVEDDAIEGIRSFELVNEGEGDIVIDHIGIDEKFYSCGLKGVQIFGLNCGDQLSDRKPGEKGKRNPQSRYVLWAKGQYNFTIRFSINLKSLPPGKKVHSSADTQFLKYKIYLYDEKGYHYKLNLVFRIADPHLLDSLSIFSSETKSRFMYWYLTISSTSFFMICVFLVRIKEEENNLDLKAQEERERNEEDPYKRMYRLRRLGRILKESTFYDSSINIGGKLHKRNFEKCIQRVTEDLLLSAKQVTQRELKKYFNESEESAIGGFLGVNHHLSMSQSISDHEALPEEPEDYPMEEVNSRQSSSNLPEGEEVQLIQSVDEDSWYDFNRELHDSHYQSARNLNSELMQEQKDEFYSVFRTDIGLKKSQLPLNNLKLHKKKCE